MRKNLKNIMHKAKRSIHKTDKVICKTEMGMVLKSARWPYVKRVHELIMSLGAAKDTLFGHEALMEGSPLEGLLRIFWFWFRILVDSLT